MFNPICQRMRRVITTAAIVFIITKSDDEWRTLIHRVNDERHIADDEAAFTLGYCSANGSFVSHAPSYPRWIAVTGVTWS